MLKEEQRRYEDNLKEVKQDEKIEQGFLGLKHVFERFLAVV